MSRSFLGTRTLVLTGLLGAAIALGGSDCAGGKAGAPGAPGANGAAGPAGANGAPASANLASLKVVSQVYADTDKEAATMKQNRNCKHQHVDYRFTAYGAESKSVRANSQWECLFTDLPQGLSRISVDSTDGAFSDTYTVYVIVEGTDAGTVNANSKVNIASTYLAELALLPQYPIASAGSAKLKAFYAAVEEMGDLEDAYSDEAISSDGMNALLRGLAETDGLNALNGLAQACVLADATLLEHEIGDTGTYVAGTDLSTGTVAGATLAADTADCMLSTLFGDATAVLTATISGVVHNAAADLASACKDLEYTNSTQVGMYGENDDVIADVDAFWGVALLAREITDGITGDLNIPAVVIQAGARTNDSSNGDTEMLEDDNVSLDLGGILGAYNLVWSDNMEVDVDATAGIETDKYTSAVVFSDTTDFADVNTDGNVDVSSMFETWHEAAANAVVVQQCHKTPYNEIVATDGSGVVGEKLNKDVLITTDSGTEKRLAAFNLSIVYVPASVDAIAALAQAVAIRLSARGEPWGEGTYMEDVALLGALNVDPVEFAIHVARSGALCDSEVVNLGGGDDVLLKTSSDVPVAEPMNTNLFCCGVAPNEVVTIENRLGPARLRADTFGCVSARVIDTATGLVPDSVTVVSEDMSLEVTKAVK